MPAKTVMFQGTASHVGKSVLTAALCRILRDQGLRVAPFKAMNMSNNAFVTADGGEIATAQAAQAMACGVAPSVEMNPVLLKVMSDSRCQAILLGRPYAVIEAGELGNHRGVLLAAIRGALNRLLGRYEFVVLEGAGSPAEINLQRTDLANMEAARLAGSPVVLVADIERGGVFAQLVGTLELLSPEDRRRILGFVINKFRGDPQILRPGLRWLEERTGLPVFGVLPFCQELDLPEEDSLAERLRGQTPRGLTPPALGTETAPGTVWIDVFRTPTMANFTDLDPLHREPGVVIRYLQRPPGNGSKPHLIILPGSKSTMADLTWLRERGLDRYLEQCAREGAEVLGICGGFQMLGEMLYDPGRTESKTTAMPGLGLLPTSTLFLASKITAQVRGTHLESGFPVRGYEIHYGRPQGLRRGRPVFRIEERGGVAARETDGCELPGKRIWGTYLHGLFDEEGFRRWTIDGLRERKGLVPPARPAVESTSDPYAGWAQRVRQNVQVGRLMDGVMAWTP